MTRRAPVLARRIDRLAVRAHLRHRYAHHPLCGAYERERIRVGRYEICRGCAFAAGGGVVGLLAGVGSAGGTSLAVLLPLSLAGAAWGIAVLGLRVRRPGKLWTRGLPAAVAGFVFCAALWRRDLPGSAMAATTLGLVALGVWLYRRRKPSRAPCVACPERDRVPCAGFRPIHRRERAVQRLTGRWLHGCDRDLRDRTPGEFRTRAKVARPASR